MNRWERDPDSKTRPEARILNFLLSHGERSCVGFCTPANVGDARIKAVLGDAI